MPVFALGRSQDVLAMIGRFKNRGLLPDDTPVYTVGQHAGHLRHLRRHATLTPRLDPDFEVYGVEQQRIPRTDAKTLEATRWAASSSSRRDALRADALAPARPEDDRRREERRVLRRLLEGGLAGRPPLQQRAAAEGPGTEVVLDAEAGPQPVYAEIGRFRFSGHAHRRDLIALVEKMQPKTVVLVHGEAAAKAWMKDNIEFFHPEVEVLIPEQGVELVL